LLIFHGTTCIQVSWKLPTNVESTLFKQRYSLIHDLALVMMLFYWQFCSIPNLPFVVNVSHFMPITFTALLGFQQWHCAVAIERPSGKRAKLRTVAAKQQ